MTYVICIQKEISAASWSMRTSLDPKAVAADPVAAWRLVRLLLAECDLDDISEFAVCVRTFINGLDFDEATYEAAELLRYLANDTNPLEPA